MKCNHILNSLQLSVEGITLDSVALTKYDGSIRRTIERSIRLLGGWGTLKSPLIIKPNIAATSPKSRFAVTDLNVVRVIVKLVLEKDADISIKIVESDSESKFADEAFEKFGYRSLEEEFKILGFDVSLVNLSRLPTISVELDGLQFKNPELPDIIIGSRYFVSIAVAKTHNMTFVTGTLKNLFGLLPRKDKEFYHPFIDEVLAGINRLVRPDLCIVDARLGLDGWEGPRATRLDTFILGRTPVSVDATMARIMGFKPERIRHLVEAEKYDLGTLRPKVLGESLQSRRVQLEPPSDLSPTALLD